MINTTINTTHQLPPSVQFKINLRGADDRPRCWQRPLGDLNTAMRDLDLSDEEIRKLVEQHMLIGFNIAVNQSGRSVTRILTYSLEHFRQTNGRLALEMKWSEIFKLIFPGRPSASTPFPAARFSGTPLRLTGLELKQGLNCCRGHVENLAYQYFEVVRPARRGRGHTPVFKTTSVERWLKRRML
jgi:hypothetical protein